MKSASPSQLGHILLSKYRSLKRSKAHSSPSPPSPRNHPSSDIVRSSTLPKFIHICRLLNLFIFDPEESHDASDRWNVMYLLLIRLPFFLSLSLSPSIYHIGPEVPSYLFSHNCFYLFSYVFAAPLSSSMARARSGLGAYINPTRRACTTALYNNHGTQRQMDRIVRTCTCEGSDREIIHPIKPSHTIPFLNIEYPPPPLSPFP